MIIWATILVCTFTWALPTVSAEESPAIAAMKGKSTFKRYCSNCHGEDAKGGGDIAKYLKVSPADLTTVRQRNDDEFSLDEIQAKIDGREKVAGHGMREMPVWGEVFQTLPQLAPTDEKGEERAQRMIREVMLFLESIQE
jgi:mono/diheme cytochrome c family protein